MYDFFVQIKDKYQQKVARRKLKKEYKRKFLLGIFVIVAIFGLGTFMSSQSHSERYNDLDGFHLFEPTIKFGFTLDTFNINEGIIQNNEFLSDLLLPHHVDYVTIDKIAKNSKDIFSVMQLRANKPYMIINKDTSTMADYFIYEPNVYRYVVYDIKNPENIQVIERPITVKQREVSGIIESSLWNAMISNGLSFDLTARMEDALAWSIDFYHVQQGDRFKLIYDEEFINGKPVGVGKLYAAYYKNYDNEYYAIKYKTSKHDGYFDLEGRSMKKAFLKSPVKFARISSRFNRRRFHPVLRRVKAHLGTDFAAPTGTPIMSVADGIIVKRGRTRGNGNYIKVKHDKMYQTQYLHMSRFQKGVTVGTHVKQGQTIGYVGSTGLATGPHVCYRFWKNGRQVDPKREKLPPPEPMAVEELPQYKILRDSVKIRLDNINYPENIDKLSSL